MTGVDKINIIGLYLNQYQYIYSEDQLLRYAEHNVRMLYRMNKFTTLGIKYYKSYEQPFR